MKTELKEAALYMSAFVEMTTAEEISEAPYRFYGTICDVLSEPKFAEAKKLIKKGLDTGAYVEILKNADDAAAVAQKEALKLMNSEFLTESHAREIVGLMLIALEAEDLEYVISVEEWIDACSEEEYDEEYDEEDEEEEESTLSTSNVSAQRSSEVEALLKRMFLFLADGNWENALQYSNRILDIDPECSRAYVGELMANLKLKQEVQLGEASTPRIATQKSFIHACNFATDEELKVLKDYEYRNAYARGKAVLSKATTEQNFKDAASWFALYPAYKDSQKLKDECLSKAENAREEAEQKKAAERRRAEAKRIEEQKAAEARRLEERRRMLAWEEERRGWGFKIVGILLGIIGLDVILTNSLSSLPLWQWLILPLISGGVAFGFWFALDKIQDKYDFGAWLIWLSMAALVVWDVIRAFTIANACYASINAWYGFLGWIVVLILNGIALPISASIIYNEL